MQDYTQDDNDQIYCDDANDLLRNDPTDVNPINYIEEISQLPGDYDTPFSPPDGVQDRIDDTHPSTDTGMDEQERYDASIEAASGIDMPGHAADEDQANNPWAIS